MFFIKPHYHIRLCNIFCLIILSRQPVYRNIHRSSHPIKNYFFLGKCIKFHGFEVDRFAFYITVFYDNLVIHNNRLFFIVSIWKPRGAIIL